MHSIRAITFDLDNTLWAIDPVIQRAEAMLWDWLSANYPRIAADHSPEALIEVREAVIEEHWEKVHDYRFLRKKALERIAVASGYSKDLVEPAFSIFDRARNEVEFYPDVMPALQRLAHDFVLVAVTNGNANLETIGIRHLFRNVVSAAETGFAKPARPIFDKAVSLSGFSREEVLHVGDHPEIDVNGARKAGLRTAWMNRHDDVWPDEIPGPDAIVTSIVELHALLAPSAQRDKQAK